jgi:acetyltransferase
MHTSDYLLALLSPVSIALVGASGKAGSDGRIVLENLLGGGYEGALYLVNPRHRRVLARRSYPSLTTIAKPIDLALIVTPAAVVAEVLEDAARAGVKAAIIFSAPPADDAEARRWRETLVFIATGRGIRMLGPHSFGVIRTGIGLNATLGSAVARGGRLALVAQSGAVCAAMLDFAWSAGIGFSTVVALGGAIDVGFGEWLDVLIADPTTDGILLYTEAVGDARRFLSALRAAARTKPVVVLRAGRSMELRPVDAPSPDAVFDAAMKRAGTVRVKTYTQLFAAARILAMNRIARGDRLAIVVNGHGPGMLAADSAADRGIVLADFSAETKKALAAALPAHMACGNPIDVHWDAPPTRIAAALEAALSDANVDAALVLHVPRPSLAATDAARAVAEVARRSTKPVLAAWLGAVDRAEATGALEAGGVANFYTPENAIDAFSFLAEYRHHQEWLLEVPPPQPEPQPPDLAPVERLRTDAVSARRNVLTAMETHALLSAFSLPVPPMASADTLSEALAVARRLGYPVTLRPDSEDAPPDSIPRERLRDGRMLTRAWAAMIGAPANRRRREAVIVAKEHAFAGCDNFAIGIATDAVFGPVITFGAAGTGPDADVAVLLPPLNARLAHGMIRSSGRLAHLPHADAGASEAADAGASEAADALARLLVQLSALACSVPWVRALSLDPVRVAGTRAEVVGARVVIDPAVAPVTRHYRHMAIHPYPVELVSDVTLPEGTLLHVRPIRPEDAALESAFVAGLSEETRYFRFFYQLSELTPSMLARFTQVDYDREMAFVAIDESAGAPSIVGVARYIMTPDRESAEFAVVVADAWHGRGVARALMRGLVACAKARGLSRLEGLVLRKNRNMLKFTEAFGFRTEDDPDDPDQVAVVLELAG